MKVLYFHQHFSTPQGAGGIRSYEMARRLLDHGHEVTMVCGSHSMAKSGLSGNAIEGRRRGIVDGIDVIEFKLPYSNRDGFFKRSMTFFRFAARSVGVALTEDYDIVFATSTPLTVALPGIIASVLRRKPFVFEVRDLWPELPKAMRVITNPVVLAVLSALEWAAYHSAQACIALAPGIAQGIQRRGVSADRVFLVPNGCDLGLFADDRGGKWRPGGVAASDFMVIFPGAHGIANGLDAVLDVAAELKRRGHGGIKFVFVGDGSTKPALVSRATREGLDNCIFLAPIPKQQLPGLIRSSDAGLMALANVPAFYYGTSPNKFFDYIAAGIPVINNYPGWIADLIRENHCGVVVPPDDPGAFADELERIFSDRELLSKMGENGRKLAEREFDRKALADRLVQVLERVNNSG